jgi:competence protein ComEC
MQYCQHELQKKDPSWSTAHAILAFVEHSPVEKQKSYKLTVSINRFLSGSAGWKKKGRMILYIEKDSLAQTLSHGDLILFAGSVQPIVNSGNPGEFDYAMYSTMQGIHYQAFLRKNHWVLVKKSTGPRLPGLLIASRDAIVQLIDKHIKGARESGLAKALLIGYKQDLDKELEQSYADTGVVHVIAISGLHLGLIYTLLKTLLNALSFFRKRKWLMAAAIVTALWAFSLLSGASASVMRSALMFTCIIAGESLQKRISLFNSLAASAFLLLVYNPFWLWDIGFQLSYTAIISIAVFTKPLYNLVFVENKLADLLWKLVSVTIAAQILTTPLSIYHFHQFPLYFIFANLVAIPLSSVILLGELALCALAFIPVIADPLGSLLTYLIRFLNYYIEAIDRLPLSVWNNLQVNLIQTMLIYFAIFFLTAWIFHNNKKALYAALSVVICVGSLRLWSFYKASGQQRIIVYNIPGHTSVDLINGRTCFYLGDSTVANDKRSQHYFLAPARRLYRVREVRARYYDNGSIELVHWAGIRILVINNSKQLPQPASRIKVDLVLVSNSPAIRMKEITRMVDCKKIVLDTSNSTWNVKNREKECELLGVPHHAVSTKGAFVMSLP